MNDIAVLKETPPWEWPKNAAEVIAEALHDTDAQLETRVAAAHLAGEIVVMGDEMAGLLLSILRDKSQPEGVRAQAAISLGPGLDMADTEGYEEDDPFSEPPFSEETFHEIRKTLRAIHGDEAVPKTVRRRALEASVRAPEDWQTDAIRTAYASGDSEWKTTAVFCMQYIDDFDEQILESLNSVDPAVRREAVVSAGASELKPAWPVIKKLISSPTTEKSLLTAAIVAAAAVNPEKSREAIEEFAVSEDEEIAYAAQAALEILDSSDPDAVDPDEDEEF
jgi:uncharacterized protein (UPF0147 family)